MMVLVLWLMDWASPGRPWQTVLGPLQVRSELAVVQTDMVGTAGMADTATTADKASAAS